MKTNQFISTNRIIILALVAFVVVSCNMQSNDLDEIYLKAVKQSKNEVKDKTIAEYAESGKDQNTPSENSFKHSDEKVYINELIQYLGVKDDIDHDTKGKAVNLSSNINVRSLYLKVEHNSGLEFIKKKPAFIVASDNY